MGAAAQLLQSTFGGNLSAAILADTTSEINTIGPLARAACDRIGARAATGLAGAVRLLGTSLWNDPESAEKVMRERTLLEDRLGSLNKIERDLGWTPRHSFDAGGLEETVDWYRENREWWEPIKSGEYKRYYETQYAARLGS